MKTQGGNAARFDLMKWQDYVIMRKMRGEATMSLESQISADVCTCRISSSISIILDYDDDEINPDFSGIMDALRIYIDAQKLQDFYFDQHAGEGDLWVIGNHKNNCMVFDLYADPHDQMGVISFGVICQKEHSDRIYALMNAMKEKTQKKIQFASYDITKDIGWLSAVAAGENRYSLGTFTRKIRYADSFADFCSQNDI